MRGVVILLTLFWTDSILIPSDLGANGRSN